MPAWCYPAVLQLAGPSIAHVANVTSPHKAGSRVQNGTLCVLVKFRRGVLFCSDLETSFSRLEEEHRVPRTAVELHQ